MSKLSKGLLILALLFSSSILFGSELSNKLKQLPGVISVEELKTTKIFSEKYLIIFEQPLNSSDPNSPKFRQRVFLNHMGYSAPVVYITEGYNANYAASENYVNELSDILQANQICVEHRYFAESKPDTLDWQYLTTRGAADDHHAIRKSLGKLYKGKWVSTGISKGGETCLLYQMYYPNDVSATIAYVAPVARSLEDGRHEPFLNNTGTAKDRKRIVTFQKEVLKRKAEIFPLFESYCKVAKLTFRIPISEVYEYCVLEYSFAFWQWVGNTERIPSKKESDSKLFQHLVTVAGPDYFSIEGSEATLPFYYQAARELGYYGYETETLAKYLSLETAKGYFEKIFFPKGMKPEFYSQTALDLEKFIQTKAKNTFIIYGEYDPWTAAAPEVGSNSGVIRVINPKGTHATRIKSLPKIQHEMVINKLNEWVK